MTLSNKPLRSLSNSKPSPPTTPSKQSTIAPPTLPKRRHILTSGPVPRDSLPKRRKKSTALIAEIRDSAPQESGLIQPPTIQLSDDVASFFKNIESNSNKSTNLKKYTPEIVINNTLDSDSETITEFHHSKQQKDTSIIDLIENDSKKDSIIAKFNSSHPHISTNYLPTTKSITKLINKHQSKLISILTGITPSHFYSIARRVHKSASPLLHARDSDILTLRNRTCYGYIGAVRAFHIAEQINDNQLIADKLKSLQATNKLIKFYGVHTFIMHVLVPELIALGTLKWSRCPDIESAYDEMEDTAEYGVYVTNTVPIKSE